MISVLGASGFIGSNFARLLKEKGVTYCAPGRDENLSGRSLGHVVYCIGMTADFRTKPFETVEAHVCKLKEVLLSCEFESLTYLSSTRTYLKSTTGKGYLDEDDDICLNTNDPFDIFAASKITGELLALSSGKPNIKIVRVSNVFGNDFQSDNFVTSIVKEAIETGKVELFTTPDSAKDYISVDDVCQWLFLLAELETTGLYNLCFGKNTSNEVIVNEVARLTHAHVVYSVKAQTIIFSQIDNSRLGNLTGYFPSKTIVQALPGIIDNYHSARH